MVRKDPGNRACILERRLEGCSPEVRQGLERVLDQFGDLAWEKGRLGQDLDRLLNLIIEMPSRPEGGKSPKPGDSKELEEAFLSRFEEDQRPYALELLDLARASYRLRDDDNIYLGKIEGQVLAAVEEGSRRIQGWDAIARPAPETDDLVRALGTDAPFKKTVGKKEAVRQVRRIFSSGRDRSLVSLQDQEWQWERRGSSSTPLTFSIFVRERSLCAMRSIPP